MKTTVPLLERLSHDVTAKKICDYDYGELKQSPSWLLEYNFFEESVPAGHAVCPRCLAGMKRIWTDAFDVPRVECEECGNPAIEEGYLNLYRLNPISIAEMLAYELCDGGIDKDLEDDTWNIGKVYYGDQGKYFGLFFAANPDPKRLIGFLRSPSACLITIAEDIDEKFSNKPHLCLHEVLTDNDGHLDLDIDQIIFAASNKEETSFTPANANQIGERTDRFQRWTHELNFVRFEYRKAIRIAGSQGKYTPPPSKREIWKYVSGKIACSERTVDDDINSLENLQRLRKAPKAPLDISKYLARWEDDVRNAMR